MPEEASEVLVIAIDYGTTFTGVAYGHRNGLRRPTHGDIQCIDDWPGTSRNSSSQKVPSEVAYSENRFDWGNKIQPRNRQREAWTKLLLDETQRENQLALMQELEMEQNGGNGGRSPCEVPKEPVDIVSDFLTGVRKHVETTLKIRYASMLQSLCREVVITVPAVWSDKAKNLTYKAVCNAGFNAENTKISMITEPEAAAIYALRDLKDGPFTTIQPGDHFVVCDAGGGTVDIITYRVESTKDAFIIKEAVVGTGDKCGAIFIDREFKSWLQRKLGAEKFGMIRHEWLRPESRMMRTFEEAKMSFEDDNIMAFVTMPPEISREDDEALDIEDGEMRLDPEDMREIFDPCVNRVLTLVDSQIDEISSQGATVKYILVVGGFGKSMYLLKRIRERYSARNIEIVRPSNSWSAVVRGAVMEKLDPVGKSLVQLRLCRRHYGASLSQPFDESTHGGDPEANVLLDERTGVRFVKGCMTWLLSKGDQLQSSKPKTTEIEIPQRLNEGPDKSFEIKILAWNESDPPKREIKGLEQVCVLSINLTGLSPALLQTKDIADKKSLSIVVCKFEIKIEGSMLEFRVLVGGQEYCRALARDA
ncbi:hypothetical protein BKA65DRAFT_37690 [Rhexocercosporidium sp. MPI-PUGE-AT-0058]|nr:hypothetical protein BKA65DRAFT_37690 [Rhexocercosporidium sp. MPI-PUGE-AT-0058]